MSLILLLIFPAFVIAAAVSDVLTLRLSNRLTGSLFLSFLIMAFILRLPLITIGEHILCGLLMLVVGFGMFARGWIGGGDAKLLAALAAWLSWSSLLEFLFVTAMFGGVLSFVILHWRRWPLSPFLSRAPWVVRLHDHKQGVPYGLALAFGALQAYPQSALALIILQM